MARLFGLRGATTLDADTRDQVMERTRELISELLRVNSIDADEIVSIMFTATPDINAEFPAAAAREMGLLGVPLICARELDAKSDLAVSMCVRIMMHLYAEAKPTPIYLHGAQSLLKTCLPQT